MFEIPFELAPDGALWASWAANVGKMTCGALGASEIFRRDVCKIVSM